MTFSLLLAVGLALSWLPFFLWRVERRADALPAYRGTERFWVQVTPALVALHVTAACVTLSMTEGLSAVRTAVGIGVDVVAIVFWFWGRVQIGPLSVRRLPDEPPRQLRHDGAFGLVRHPLYCSYLIASGAPLIISPRPFLLLTYALCVIALTIRSVQEERRLRGQLGSVYDAYCRQVKRFVPFVW